VFDLILCNPRKCSKSVEVFLSAMEQRKNLIHMSVNDELGNVEAADFIKAVVVWRLRNSLPYSTVWPHPRGKVVFQAASR
jgi:hypothetical protein